jgi:hypothetical protein
VLDGEQCPFPRKSQRVALLSQTVPVYDTTAYPICGSPQHSQKYSALLNRIESDANSVRSAIRPEACAHASEMVSSAGHGMKTRCLTDFEQCTLAVGCGWNRR